MSNENKLSTIEFDKWWEVHGQFCRAGGGDYEKTFAYNAWQAAQQKILQINKNYLQQVMNAILNSTPLPLETDDDYCDGSWNLRKEALSILGELING